MEVEEMIKKVREEQGRPFDVKQLITSCVVNVVTNILFGRRFDHSDPVFQQLKSDIHHVVSDMSMVLEIFPVLRFFPYFKANLATFVKSQRSLLSFISSHIPTCIEVTFAVFCAIFSNFQQDLFIANVVQ